MIELDKSQQAFCKATSRNIRLLAPAGCGKTISLLYRCRDLASRSKESPRFLIITFTNVAAESLRAHLRSDDSLRDISEQITISTLNAHGWGYVRREFPHATLIDNEPDKRSVIQKVAFALDEQSHVSRVLKHRQRHASDLIKVMDNLKSMGFDHTRHVERSDFYNRVAELESEGLGWWFDEQLSLLGIIGLFKPVRKGSRKRPPTKGVFFDRFYTFWIEATEKMKQDNNFTFEDQKYWAYLNMNPVAPERKRRRFASDEDRFDHIFVDEFQDINSLDLALIKTLRERHRARLVIVGDDDQAIFEWRGATPRYILKPEQYFDVPSFVDRKLRTNYRSPKQIVHLSQSLIRKNRNRKRKNVKPAIGARDADISLTTTSDMNSRLRLVTDLVRDAASGKVAVIGRHRRQLIPFEIYYASGGARFKTAPDLDVFASRTFNHLMTLLRIWGRRREQRHPEEVVDDTIFICDRIRRRRLYPNTQARFMRSHLLTHRSTTTVDAIDNIATYTGPELHGKSPYDLQQIGARFINSSSVGHAINCVAEGFDGFRQDSDRAEDDIWFTGPPLDLLADLAISQNYDAFELVERLRNVINDLNDFDNIGINRVSDNQNNMLERPLHLMTAHRSKGKEFDTVVILDVDEGHWPGNVKDERELEAERRLFYVAFTRAQRRVIMLHEKDEPLSRFVEELGDKELIRSVA